MKIHSIVLILAEVVDVVLFQKPVTQSHCNERLNQIVNCLQHTT